MTSASDTYRELDYRAADGVEVGLFWNPVSDGLVVVVDDARSGERFELDVSATEALDAFEHPYAYAARRGARFAAGPRTAVGARP